MLGEKLLLFLPWCGPWISRREKLAKIRCSFPGGVERRWWWRSGNGGTKGERETTNCRSCSDCISHARSTPDGRTDLRGFGCVLCHSLPRKIDSELTRNAYTPPSRFLTPLFDILVVQFICIRVHGPTCIFFMFFRSFRELIYELFRLLVLTCGHPAIRLFPPGHSSASFYNLTNLAPNWPISEFNFTSSFGPRSFTHERIQ